MAEYIEREKIYDLLGGAPIPYGVGAMMWINITQDLIDEVEKIPAADVRPEIHSKWVEKNSTFECRKCGYAFEHEGYVHFFNFCPCCGAKMDG